MTSLNKVYSPFDQTVECNIIGKQAVSEIIDIYIKEFGIDVTVYFKDFDFIWIYECPISQLRFYYPFGLDGNSMFYDSLSNLDWYYQPSRWEFYEALNFIKPGDSLLEIGSGTGSFGKKVKDKISNIEYRGIEMNPQAANAARKIGLNVQEELLKNIKARESKQYDIVCSFQVFEHVSDICELWTDALSVLKSGGLLVVAVPNNDAIFLNHNILLSRVLNMPPHHVNLFNGKSLERISHIFNLELVSLVKEPIQDLHIDTYLYNKLYSIFFRINFFPKLIWKLRIHKLLRLLVKRFKNAVTGHTILAVYKKK